MNRLSYSLFIWKSHRGLALFSIIFIAALQFVIIELITSFDTAPIISAILKQIPERFRFIFGEQLVTLLTVRGAASFGFNHPLVLVLLSINAIIIPAKHISGEIEGGTLELLLSYPLTRTRLCVSLWASAVLYLFFIVASAFVSSLLAITIYKYFTFDFLFKMLQIGINLWLLAVLIMSYTLLISTFGKEGNKTGTFSAAITLVFYLIFFLSSIWDSIEFTKPFNIFTYYQPQSLMFDQQSFLLNFGVLITLIGICLLISIKQFNKRDIPG